MFRIRAQGLIQNLGNDWAALYSSGLYARHYSTESIFLCANYITITMICTRKIENTKYTVISSNIKPNLGAGIP